MPKIAALGRLRQENQDFQTSLGYIARPCLKKKLNCDIDFYKEVFVLI
jgi:hypothetical protein